MRTEKTFAIIALVGIIFRLLYWKGADLITMLSLTALGFMYIFFAFYFFSDKSIKNQNLPLSIITGIFLGALPLGILFRWLHWRGGETLLLFGLTGVAFLLIAILIIRKDKKLETYYNRLLLRCSILWILALALFATPVPALYKLQNIRHPELAQLKIRQYYNFRDQSIQDSIDNYLKNLHSQN